MVTQKSILVLLILCLFSASCFAEKESYTIVRADDRITFQMPDQDWRWEEVKLNQEGYRGYLLQTGKVPGMYALIMVFDNPTYSLPDKDLLNDLSTDLMTEYPEYSLLDNPVYGNTSNLKEFAYSTWADKSGKTVHLTVAGSKKVLVYILISYESLDQMKNYSSVMNHIAETLTIL